ncbi:MAG: radical SAM family heme chaperone HemW [Armatimonadota bacterium]|nr:radical SAM family heme chaperone HemW [bacterium]
MTVNNSTCDVPPEAAYVHVPFCLSKCHYCDFNSYAGMQAIFDDYANALMTEIKRTGSEFDTTQSRPLDSVYFGGGTPTVLSADILGTILATIDETLHLSPDAEITIEANPGTVDEYKLVELQQRKFNRLSLGIQSFDDEFLAKIGRVHTADQAITAYHLARQAGFKNVGLDLIFALPGQTLEHWSRTLDTAIQLSPEHVSLYELSIEEGTRFADLCAQGRLELPDEDTQLAMYELAISKITSAGYEHYEVSNFARPGFRSRHNQVYWRNDPYYAFGAGATSYVHCVRARRVGSPAEYIQAIYLGSDGIEFSERLTGRALVAETIIQGLRMLDGIRLSKISQKYFTDIASEFAVVIQRLQERGLVELVGDCLRVTHNGLLLLNDVAQEFIS